MADAPTIEEINACALAHRDAVLAAILIRDARSHRVSNEIRALNWDAPRLVNLHVTLDAATGRWSASADTGFVSGRGFTSLVATLADINIDRAAAFVARILPPEAAA